MLYTINHDHKGKLWCGPAAIAAVTGHSTSEVMRVAHAECLRNRIMGMSPGELTRTMLRLGYRGVREMRPHVTLAEFARTHAAEFAKHPMIVCSTEHYMVLFGRRFVDSGNRTPLFLRDAPYRRSKLVWAVSWQKVGEPDIPREAPKKERDNTMAKARRLAAKHGIEIESERYPDGMCYWVTCPALEDDDPHEGCQFATNAQEAMDMVEDYVKHLTSGYLEAVTAPCMLPESHPGYQAGVL